MRARCCRYEQPPGCPASGCRAKQLVPDRRYSTTRDWQKVKIQEAPGGSNEYEADNSSYGRVPRQMDVELSEGLIDCCVPGDVLEVRLRPTRDRSDRAGSTTPLCFRESGCRMGPHRSRPSDVQVARSSRAKPS